MSMHKKRDSLIWGFIFIAFGFIFLLQSFDVDVWNTIWRFWPVIFILWGANKLYVGIKERNPELPAPSGEEGDKEDAV